MIPKNEQGVIVMFAQQAAHAGYTILAVQTAFPDMLVEKDGIVYRAEFEFKASSFLSHRHDLRKCDLIICYENDLDDFILPILALSNPEWHATKPVIPAEENKEHVYMSTIPPKKRPKRPPARPKKPPGRAAPPVRRQLTASKATRKKALDTVIASTRPPIAPVKDTPPDVYHYETADDGLELCMACARKRRAKGQTLEVLDPPVDVPCTDCGKGP